MATLENIPPEVGFYVGDVIQSFRSSLDYLVFEMSTNYTPSMDDKALRDAEFPICGDISQAGHAGKGREIFQSARRKIASIHPDAQAEIERLQPYQYGQMFQSHPLWQLNELSRIDKHRAIHVVAAYTHQIQAYGLRDESKATIDFHAAYAPKGETEVARITAHERVATHQDAVDMDIRPTASIAFQGGLVANRDVPEFLNYMWLYLYRDVFPRFERFF